LGDPQEELAFVHIAGSNGKGSVLAFISTMLKAAGYRTGRYISPTLFKYRERIQINEHIISKADLCLYLTRVRAAADQMVAAGLPHPTAFEIDTAMAFAYFRDKQCDIVVLETGMGGRFDATNIVTNTLVAVLTPIAMDHQQYLGSTEAEIADNKAGIIKSGCTVVSADQTEAVADRITERCGQLDCPVIWTQPKRIKERSGRLGRFTADRSGKPGGPVQTFHYFTGSMAILMLGKGAQREGEPCWEIILAGKYQMANASLALEVMAVLAKKGYPVTVSQCRRGLAATKWPGRFQLIADRPLFIVDGAHNGAAAGQLAESIKFYFTNRRIIYIIGMLKDKDYQEIIRPTAELAEHIITVTTPGPRGLSSYELSTRLLQEHQAVTCADSLEEAAELATLLAGRDGIIIAFGSLSYLGRMIKIVTGREGRPNDGSRKNRGGDKTTVGRHR
jgi:dihydrofolate synthase/folylpolyglutamate synthase